jgi:hypothetical protein
LASNSDAAKPDAVVLLAKAETEAKDRGGDQEKKREKSSENNKTRF